MLVPVSIGCPIVFFTQKEMPVTHFKPSELFELPNLVSLSRIALGPLMLLTLSWESSRSTILAAAIMILAGISDGLDGYLARRRGQVTAFGVALDPIADKAFALFLLVGLFLFRDIPIWLLAVLLGRDLLILIGGVYLTRKFDVSLPSNITGKYTFASISVLLGAYIIEYRFGIQLMIPITLLLSVASVISYGAVFCSVFAGKQPKPFEDTKRTRAARLAVTIVLSAVFVVGWFREFLLN